MSICKMLFIKAPAIYTSNIIQVILTNMVLSFLLLPDFYALEKLLRTDNQIVWI